jgi:hypothetical protein
MQISFELGTEFQKAVSDLSDAGVRLRAGVNAGIAEGIDAVGQKIAAGRLTGQDLAVRTGNLRRAVKGWMSGDLAGVIGVMPDSAVDHYKYLLGDEQVTIRPKKGKFLSVPLPDALTAAGVLKPEYSQGLRNIDGGFFIRSKGQLIFGKHAGKTKRSKFLPLFVMKTQVTVKGRNSLYDGVMENLGIITDTITDRIQEAL